MSEITTSQRPRVRPDLSNRRLRHFGWVAMGLCVVLMLLLRLLPAELQRPGSALMQSVAIAGALLLLVPFVFSLKKRGGSADMPNRLFIAHVVASLAGTVLVVVHAASSFSGPPLFMVLFLVLLVVTGVLGRTLIARLMAQTIGTKASTFAPQPPAVRDEIRDLIERKTALLQRIDPQASEGLFSLTPRHWLKSPVRAWQYSRLVARETTLVGAKTSVSFLQAWWRTAHMLLAWLFLLGLIVHVILVTFFAGYVAEGRDVYWWHLFAW